jgi:hypothetical protein
MAGEAPYRNSTADAGDCVARPHMPGQKRVVEIQKAEEQDAGAV